jgi:glycerophosphoryl diester phosphodiesterase
VSSPLILLTSAHGAPYDLASAGDPTSYADLAAARGLRSISGIVNGIGPDKSQIIARNTGGWPDMMCGWSMTLSCISWGATV